MITLESGQEAVVVELVDQMELEITELQLMVLVMEEMVALVTLVLAVLVVAVVRQERLVETEQNGMPLMVRVVVEEVEISNNSLVRVGNTAEAEVVLVVLEVVMVKRVEMV